MTKRKSIQVRNILAFSKASQASLDFLIKNRSKLDAFTSVEDFVIHAIEANDKQLSGIIHHMEQVRALLARRLWANGIFIGVSVLDMLMFWSLKQGSVVNPASQVLHEIEHSGLHHPGFVLYPLHSFGIVGLGLARFFSKSIAHFVDKNTGIAITPQTNSRPALTSFLDDSVNQLGLKRKIPYDMLDHFIRSRGLKWATRNPLFLVKVRSFSGDYYENQTLLKTKLQLAMSYVFVLGALSNMLNSNERARFFSTSSMNNWETLDIHHYLVFETPIHGKGAFTLRCIPLNVSTSEMVELSNLNVEFDPKEWRRRPALELRVRSALESLQTGYLQHSLYGVSKSTRARFYRKMFTSLRYFRRSFRESPSNIDGIINLAIAFETLLTDFYSPGVTLRVRDRLRLAIHGASGVRSLVESVEQLFSRRGSLLHQGYADRDLSVELCRKSYSLAFLSIMEKAPSIPLKSDQIIGELLGDVRDASEVGSAFANGT